MVTVGLLASMLWFCATVGRGFPWSTPENAYAPIIADVGPAMVTTMSAEPVGLTRYQNSASLLKNEITARLSATPPKVTDATFWLLALIPTKRRRSLPIPALKPLIVSWYGGIVVVPEVDLTLASAITLAEVVEVDEVVVAVVEEVVLEVVVVVAAYTSPPHTLTGPVVEATKLLLGSKTSTFPDKGSWYIPTCMVAVPLDATGAEARTLLVAALTISAFPPAGALVTFTFSLSVA